MRQKDDIEFANMLNRVQESTHTEEDLNTLKSRLVEKNTTQITLMMQYMFFLIMHLLTDTMLRNWRI